MVDKKLSRRQAEQLAGHYKHALEMEKAKVEGLSITFQNFGVWIEENLSAEQKESLAAYLEEKANETVSAAVPTDGRTSGTVLDDTPKIWVPDQNIIQ